MTNPTTPATDAGPRGTGAGAIITAEMVKAAWEILPKDRAATVLEIKQALRSAHATQLPSVTDAPARGVEDVAVTAKERARDEFRYPGGRSREDWEAYVDANRVQMEVDDD